MKLSSEYQYRYGKVTISREELRAAFGFDTNDAFDVHLDSHQDGHGITFTLHNGRSEKYEPKPQPETPPKKRRWRRK